MNNELDLLLTVRSAKNKLAKYDTEQLSQIYANIGHILEQRKKKDEALKLKEAEKQEKLTAYLEMLASDGITVDDLMSSKGGKSKVSANREPLPAKYRINSEDGVAVEWAGRGRMSLAFSQALNASGCPLEEFEIKA